MGVLVLVLPDQKCEFQVRLRGVDEKTKKES
jgi:hypothetical protein